MPLREGILRSCQGYEVVRAPSPFALPSCVGRHRPAAAALVAALCFTLIGCGDRQVASRAVEDSSDHAAALALTWPMTRGGPALSGNVATDLPVDPVIAWTFASSGPVTGEATVIANHVFVGTETGTLHCLAADTGGELWRFAASDGIAAAPAVDDARVFVSCNDGQLYALDVATGAEVWRFGTEDKISAGAIVIASPEGDGTTWVLVNGYDGTTRALRAGDGSVIWSYATEDFINGSPAVVDGRFVVFGGCDAQLHVVNLGDGTPLRTIPAEAYIPASVGTFGLMAYCGNYANQTMAFDVIAGEVAWTYEDRGLPFFSSPAVNEAAVFIGSRDKHLHAIARTSGEALWKFRTGGRVEGSPILFRNGVVFGSTDGRLYAASLEAGTEVWRLELGEALVASPAFGAGQIVISGEKGTVFAIRPRNSVPR